MNKRRYHHRTATPRNEEIIELRVGEPAHGGACVARDVSGRVVFVRHTLPGEKVKARVTSVQKNLAWADAVEILEASADRVPSVWPQAGPGGVGGGELTHVAPAAQRAWKETVLRGQLRRVGGEALSARVEDLGGVTVRPAPGDEADQTLLHRRTRIEVVIDRAGLAGMHPYRGTDVIALDSMPLASESIERLGLWGANSKWAPFFKPADRVRVVAPDGHSPVVVTPRGTFNSLGEKIKETRLPWRLWVNGEPLEYRVRVGGFWQTHVMGAEVLAHAVMDVASLSEGDRVMELYSGAGLFSVPMAKAVGARGRIVTLEGSEGAVEDAGENCASFGWVEPYVGNVDAEGVRELAVGLEGRPDVIVLDPPRAGAGREVTEAIVQCGASKIVLVSCDPAAGARDMRLLTEAGYELASLNAWDLFPHTHHLETVALLQRVN